MNSNTMDDDIYNWIFKLWSFSKIISSISTLLPHPHTLTHFGKSERTQGLKFELFYFHMWMVLVISVTIAKDYVNLYCNKTSATWLRRSTERREIIGLYMEKVGSEISRQRCCKILQVTIHSILKHFSGRKLRF
jgi:hypothetical protein